MTIGEHFMNQGRDVLLVLDDLTRHARAYRELSLLLRRPPGREAFPGDIFYIHARLLERSTHLGEDHGGGSLTALPIVETEAQNISAYIPTNLISITDGQIYLEGDLFFAGQRPAVNVGLSVSRVGGNAQIKAMKQIAGSLRLDLAQYRELAAFAQFGSDLDKATQNQLARGERLMEILKQGQFAPLPVELQIVSIFAGTKGHVDRLRVSAIGAFDPYLHRYAKEEGADLLEEIVSSGQLTEETEERLDSLVAGAVERFLKEHPEAAIAE
jgi:F-type H+-transporting ATPase subunit alpha